MGIFNLHQSEFVTNRSSVAKSYICINAEKSGGLKNGCIQFAFGNGASGQNYYGFDLITPSTVVGYSICSTSSNSLVGTIQINLMINGVENVNYQLIKPSNKYTEAQMFDTPLELKVGDRINFVT